MKSKKLEVTFNCDNVSIVKNIVKNLTLKYYEDPFLENKVFIEVEKVNLEKLKRIKGIEIKDEKYAYQTNSADFHK